MKLLISQKNNLFDIIEAFDLSPSQFEFNEAPNAKYTTQVDTILRYKNSDYFFRFETGYRNSEHHHATFCPGKSSYIQKSYSEEWVTQINVVVYWLENLIREITSPNKWQRLEQEIQNININFDNEEDKFSVHEYEDLVRKINTLKEELPKIGLLSEQLDLINSKLDHLTELAKNLNKFDWKGLFVGTIISIVIQLEVTPSNAQSLWSLIHHIFNSYLLR